MPMPMFMPKNYTRFVTFKNLFEKYVDDCLQIDHM